ncbi:hypothetical protein GS610_10185 [Ruegeria sp. HKCCD6228]|uniref:Uncharacterized protein n=1 Tax=Ruegeria atlantica TaxID=81569 RepID=A0AA90YXC3_9RHOB|nr:MULTISPECIES: hypothetical protein [Ruegeria]NOC83076.1 hypothetical protein [Ruegeria sp. HKCCD6428]NOC93840.1 hypothetical protein [Ruegeria sp. HKCCD6604]NOD97578.1 hypothetical protein [Ruegeria sp. HKCCD6228]NOE19565.1 hypothetical protein [Ruegeria atlantica]
MLESDWTSMTAVRLAELYDQDFGGKPNGRYRIPDKLVRRIAGRRRLYETDIRALSVALFELGYVLIDMDTFYVVMSANSFVNYRRANDDCLE